jgi:hypothetical protein
VRHHLSRQPGNFRLPDRRRGGQGNAMMFRIP